MACSPPHPDGTGGRGHSGRRQHQTLPASLLLTLAIKNGNLTHVAEVSSGLACDCECPACGKRLMAKKGSVRQQHFAHMSGTECNGAMETALHLLAKEILERRLEIVLPAAQVQFQTAHPPKLIAPERKYQLDSVVTEMHVGQIVPDVIAYIKGRQLFIEIRVTHPVDDQKRDRIRALGAYAMEIDLSTTPRAFMPAELEPLIIESGANKTWLHHARVERERARMLSEGRRLRIVERGCALHVDGCPITSRLWNGHPFANVTDDCAQCEHCLKRCEETVICGATESSK